MDSNLLNLKQMEKKEITLDSLKADFWEEVSDWEHSIILERKGKKHHYKLLWNKEDSRVVMVIELNKDGTHSIMRNNKQNYGKNQQ